MYPTRSPRRILLTAAIAAVLPLVACGGAGSPESPDTSAATSPEATSVTPVTPTLEQAANATYVGLWDDPVTLADGRFDDEAERLSAWLNELTATGDLDGDGVEDRVVTVGESSGGTGSFLYVAALLAADGGTPLPVAFVGDRVRLRDMRVDQGTIRLDVLQAGEQDAMCCPGELATRRWAVRDGGLQEEEMQITGRLSLAAVAGEWTLVAWDFREPAELEQPITLTIDGSRLAGSSGCNRYTAEATEGESAGDLSVGPVAGTRMMCPEPIMQAEARYLAALGSATKIGFLNGRLALTSNVGGQVATLQFALVAEPVE